MVSPCQRGRHHKPKRGFPSTLYDSESLSCQDIDLSPFSLVDLLLVPSLRDEMLTISDQTGNPSLTLRAGFVEVSEARSD